MRLPRYNLIWKKRCVRVSKTADFETRTWETVWRSYRVQFCRIRLNGAPQPYYLASWSIEDAKGWCPISRHKTKAAAMRACQQHFNKRRQQLCRVV